LPHGFEFWLLLDAMGQLTTMNFRPVPESRFSNLLASLETVHVDVLEENTKPETVRHVLTALKSHVTPTRALTIYLHLPTTWDQEKVNVSLNGTDPLPVGRLLAPPHP
jgi:hypothetical protein